MAENPWADVDAYVSELLAPHDEVLEAALKTSAEAGLPEIQVSAPQGKLLQILARSIDAQTILEFGTLGGYSTIWLARGLAAGGRLVSLEADPAYAKIAQENIVAAGLAGVVDLRVGPALDLLSGLEAEGIGPLDFTFIDADKANTPAYFDWALPRMRPGGMIVADNVVRDGTLADTKSEDPKVQAQRRLHETIAADPRVDATTIQTVGVKGYDGFTVGTCYGWLRRCCRPCRPSTVVRATTLYRYGREPGRVPRASIGRRLQRGSVAQPLRGRPRRASSFGCVRSTRRGRARRPGRSVGLMWTSFRSRRCRWPRRVSNAVTGDGGNNSLTGTEGGDVMKGLVGNDNINGLGGDDCIRGGPGADKEQGGDGNDQLNGGQKKDKLSAGSGDDLVKVRAGRSDTVDCGGGNDSVRAGRNDKIADNCEKVNFG